MSAMHVGVTLPLNAARAREQVPDIRRAAERAEQVGQDGVWAGDHLTTGSPILDSTMAFATAG